MSKPLWLCDNRDNLKPSKRDSHVECDLMNTATWLGKKHVAVQDNTSPLIHSRPPCPLPLPLCWATRYQPRQLYTDWPFLLTRAVPVREITRSANAQHLDGLHGNNGGPVSLFGVSTRSTESELVKRNSSTCLGTGGTIKKYKVRALLERLVFDDLAEAYTKRSLSPLNGYGWTASAGFCVWIRVPRANMQCCLQIAMDVKKVSYLLPSCTCPHLLNY